MIGSCSGTHISTRVVDAEETSDLSLNISRNCSGALTLDQGGAAVTFADCDALQVAKAILAAAGYDGISFYRNLGGVCVDVGDADPPNAENVELQDLLERRKIPQPQAELEHLRKANKALGRRVSALSRRRREGSRANMPDLIAMLQTPVPPR